MFQFPSNGKADRKLCNEFHHVGCYCVSIPFKRESGSQAARGSQRYQFLIVSIPFKRESELAISHQPSAVSKEAFLLSGNLLLLKVSDSRQPTAITQFPSNGKADTKDPEIKAELRHSNRFNSLQTGKRIQRQMLHLVSVANCSLVSIPFKRESGYKGGIPQGVRQVVFVSIPFKRESGYKVMARNRGKNRKDRSFNSLQTGKRIQRPL